MTCIVAVKEGNNLYFGADSKAGSPTTGEGYTVSTPKVFRVGEYLVGYTISFRAGQVIHHDVDWPAPPADLPPDQLESFMVREVVPRLRNALRDGGAVKISEGVEQGAHFLIGLRGQLFSVGLDFSAVSMPADYVAIGSGRHNAYGALHAVADLQMAPEDRIRRALAAAASYTMNVGGPFLLISNAENPPPAS